MKTMQMLAGQLPHRRFPGGLLAGLVCQPKSSAARRGTSPVTSVADLDACWPLAFSPQMTCLHPGGAASRRGRSKRRCGGAGSEVVRFARCAHCPPCCTPARAPRPQLIKFVCKEHHNPINPRSLHRNTQAGFRLSVCRTPGRGGELALLHHARHATGRAVFCSLTHHAFPCW